MMLYYIIIITPLLLLGLRWLLTNLVIPHLKKVERRAQLNRRTDWADIENKIRVLELIYQGVYAKSSSRWYRLMHLIRDQAFIYGEIDFLSFYTILERVSPTKQDIFYDLGSGSGKAVLSAMLFFNFHKSIGIELLPPLYHQSNIQLQKATQQLEQHAGVSACVSQMQRAQFINDNFLHFDFSNADIVYVAATCLSDSTWRELIAKMAYLKPGSRIIVATRIITHERFELSYQGLELMSWGLCPVRIYQIRQLKH